MSQQNGNVLRRPTGNHIEQGTEAVRPNHMQSHIHDYGYAGRLLRIPVSEAHGPTAALYMIGLVAMPFTTFTYIALPISLL